MKTTLKTLLLVTATSSSMSAATLVGTSFDFAGGQIVQGGVSVDSVNATAGQTTASFGYFTIGFDVATAVSTNDYAGLFSNFNSISVGDPGNTTSTFGEDYAGLFDTGAVAFTTNAASIGRTIFSLYSLGGSLSAASLEAAYALLDSGQTIVADTFPETDYVVFAASGSVVGLNNASIGTGTFTATAVGETGVTAPVVNFITVPEPSTALLGAIGVLALLRRRRI